MNCELLSVGTELLLGNTVNTNAAELSQLLAELGINVYWHSVVGDNPARLRESLALARRRADLIITTGGLGPTYDDLTKTVVAEAFSKSLVYHREEEDFIRDWFRQNASRPYTENNAQQAWLPEGCEVFRNHWGTAPGCAFEAEGTLVILLPGPPRECLPMFRRWALPYLKQRCGETLVSRQIKIFGMGESRIEALLREKMQAMVNPSLATYAKTGEVMLRVTAKAADAETAAAMCEPVVQEVKALLGDLVYGVDVDSLEALCLQELKKAGKSFATAESLTGGLIGARFAALSGASEVFRGGVISYCNEVKNHVLGVSAADLERLGAVSAPVAAQMAEGARRVLEAELAVSATGLAGPNGDGVNPVGTVFVGLAAPEGTWVRRLRLGPRGRDAVRSIAAHHAFDMLRRYLTGLPVIMEEDT